MVIKNSPKQTNNPEELLNCVFEVLANSMKNELDKILKLNKDYTDLNQNILINAQRKQLLAYLFNTQETSELNKFSEHFVHLFGLEQNFEGAINDSSITLSKLCVKIIDDAEKCKQNFNYLHKAYLSQMFDESKVDEFYLKSNNKSAEVSAMDITEAAKVDYEKSTSEPIDLTMSKTTPLLEEPKEVILSASSPIDDTLLKHPCCVCKLKFDNKIKLIRHLHLNHAGEKIHKCDKCSKAFTKRNILNKHVNFYHNENVATRYTNYSCKTCSKVFRQKHVMQQHMRVHSGEKPFCCDLCHKGFAQKASLCRHLKTHVSIEAKELFKCDQCKKDYSSKQGLKAHLKTHSQVESYRGTYCYQSLYPT